MTEAQAKELLHETWENGWDQLHPTDPDDPDHVPYTYLAEVKFTTAAAGKWLGAWARLRMEETSFVQTTQGEAPHRKYEHRGNIFVQLFQAISHIDPDGNVLDGDGPLQTLVEHVRDVLHGKNVDGFYTFEARREPLKESGWNACVVVIPYMYEETR